MGSTFKECGPRPKHQALASGAKFNLHGICIVKVRGIGVEKTVQPIKAWEDHKGDGGADRRGCGVVRGKALEGINIGRPEVEEWTGVT